MTSIAGYTIRGAVCCGARYKTPRYASINLMASAFWTDGYREQSLMPNDHGLRRCQCGRFLLQRELVAMEEVDRTDLPLPARVLPQDLPLAIAQADQPDLERAARLDQWLHLNHAYRDLYRAHREAEEAATQAAWEAAHPEKPLFGGWWRKKGRRTPYRPAPDRPITFPVFVASPAQRENMLALLDLLDASDLAWAFERVELHRELGQFDEAAQALQLAPAKDAPNLHQLSAQLIEERHTAPVRYRL